MARGLRITWRGQAGNVSVQTLQDYHAGLQSRFGWAPVGAPVVRQRANGKAVAAALYDEAVVLVIQWDTNLIVEAVIRRSVDRAQLKQFTQATFGFTGNPIGIEDEAQLEEDQ